ncbi:hypothetical protein E2542_SST01499 [Spatholobus suberectus]|nr:hypothetical protein E2542_SST01499 [Spatholobus suberectus]
MRASHMEGRVRCGWVRMNCSASSNFWDLRSAHARRERVRGVVGKLLVFNWEKKWAIRSNLWWWKRKRRKRLTGFGVGVKPRLSKVWRDKGLGWNNIDRKRKQLDFFFTNNVVPTSVDGVNAGLVRLHFLWFESERRE